jgi:hypothetical protein
VTEPHRYTVVVDTREQQPLTFNATDRCAGTVVRTLKTGDYTLEGYEDLLCIERKGCTAEFAANILEDRFERELERMEAYRFPILLCQFTADDVLRFPYGSGVPRQRWGSLRVKAPFLLKRLTEIGLRYRTKVFLAGARARDLASSIFKRVVELCPPTT